MHALVRSLGHVDAEARARALGKTLVPLRIYLKHGLIKVEIALCTGKKMHDKRETLKRKVVMRETEREMRRGR